MKIKVGELFNKPIVQGNENILLPHEILVEQNGDTISLKKRVNGKVTQITSGGNESSEINDGREYYFVPLDLREDETIIGNSLSNTVVYFFDGKDILNFNSFINPALCIELGDFVDNNFNNTKQLVHEYEYYNRLIPITRYNYFNLNDITQPVFVDSNVNKYIAAINFNDSTIVLTHSLINRIRTNNVSTTLKTLRDEKVVAIELTNYRKENGLEYIDISTQNGSYIPFMLSVQPSKPEEPKPEEPTYLRYTHYLTNNATGGYYIENSGEFEFVEFNNSTIEVKLDSDYSGNYKEGYALFSVTFPGTDENGYVKNSREYTYNEELGLITIQGVLQGSGSYNPLTERKDINLKLTNGGRTLQLLNEHVISTTSPNVWTKGLVELNGVEE